MQKNGFEKIPHPSLIRTLKTVGIEGNYFKHHKSHLSEAHSQYRPQWGKTESIPPEIRNKTEMSTLTPVVEHSVGSLSISNQTVNEIKGIIICNDEVKLPLFADGMTLYMEFTTDIIKSHLALKSEFSNVAGYKINVQKLGVFDTPRMKQQKEK